MDIKKNMKAGGWIPVEEKLPEKDVEVLICLKEKNGMAIAHMWTIGKTIKWSNEYGEFDHEDVLAWMPLPKWMS